MAIFDQLGDAAGSISNRLRRTASIVPEGTSGKVKKTKARFSENPFREDQTLRGAAGARPELPFQESQKRAQQAEAIVNRAAAEGRPLAPDEQAFVDRAPGGYPEFKIGEGQGQATMMSGGAAQAMSDSRPYNRRMLRADQPDLGLGDVAQKSLAAEMAGTVPTGNVNQTLQDVYGEYASPAPGTIYDLPNEYLNLPPGELRNRLATSSGENIVDTRGIPYRQESRQGYGYQGSPYQNLDAIPIEDRATATGNPMDSYLQGFNRERASFGANPELMAQAQDILDRGGNPVIPFGSQLGTDGIETVRQGNELTIGTLGGSDLSRRLRQSSQMQPIYNSPTERVAVTRGRGTGALAFNNGQVVVVPETNIGGSLVQQPLSYSRGVEELRNAQVANPVQVDFRQIGDPIRKRRDAIGRARSARLDQEIMDANAFVTGADTTNFVIKDVNPDEYYLYGSQADTQGLLPEEVAGASRTYGYQPSESLVNVGFSSKQVKPVNLGAGRVGLGVDITAQDPYSRAAVTRLQPSLDQRDLVRDPRYVPVDPITPIDLELPGVRYAEKSGLQADVTPEMAIAQDRQTAARLRAIADIDQAPARKLTGGNIPYRGVDDQGKPLTYVSPEGRVIEGWSLQSPDQPISETSLQRLMQDPSVTRRMEVSANNQAMSDIYEGSAANMENAMRIANEQTAPQGNVILTQISNQGPGQSIPIRGQEMPFEEALEIMKPYERGGAAEQVLRLPVVPTVAPEQTQLSKRLRLAQQVGTPESASIMSDPAVGLYKQIAKADPDVQVNELRRGVQYTMIPKGETGQAYDIRLDNPGVPVIDPNTGQRMKWQGQPIETFNPLNQANPSGPEFAVRPRATRQQLKQETYQQTADAIDEGYVLRGTGDPYDRVLVSGDDLSEMRDGLSRQEMRQAQQHNLAREMSGLAPLDPVEMTNILKKYNLNMQDRTVNLIKNPPAQGGVFMWGDDDFGYGSSMAARFPSSGPPIEVQSGGMLDAFMTQPLEPRMMHPRIRQVDPSGIQAQGPLVYRPAPQVLSQVQPARIEGRADLDWQRSPSFRFPQNVWQGSGR